MSQKTAKRTRKATDSPIVENSKSKQTDEKPEIINQKNETKKDSTNGTKENGEEVKLQTKDNSDEKTSKEKDAENVNLIKDQSEGVEDVAATNSDINKSNASEEESVETELSLQISGDEQSNGVQILVEEVIENEKSNESKAIETDEKEEIVNGESHSKSHEFKSEIVTEHVDGKKTYSLEVVDVTRSQNESDSKNSSPNETYTQKELFSPNETSQTLADLSTQAVVGSDATRVEENFEYSRFLTASKDQPLTESLRHLSARRSIRRSYYPADLNAYNLNRGDVRKRKYYEEEPQELKRTKKDSPGIMSYFGYAFNKKPEASSTPKLTGYKSTDSGVFDDMSKILNTTTNSNDEKTANKWCSVM